MKRVLSILAFAAIIAYIGLCAVKHAEQGIAEYQSKQQSVLQSIGE